MGSVRCYALRCAAVVLLSSVFFMSYLIIHKEHDQEAFEDYWSCLSLYSTSELIQNESGKKTEGKRLSELDSKEDHVIFNVTDVVLKELKRGFFAAISENTVSGSSLDGAVCVSEPTVLECLESGFAALLLATLDHVSYCHMLGIHKVTIHWKNCQSSCTKDPQKNSWPAYFEPLNAGTELTADKVLCLGGSIAGRVLVSESTRTFMRSNTQQNEQFNFMFTRTSSLLEVGFRKRQSLPGYEQGATITPELRKWVYGVITEHVRPQKSIQSRVDHYYTSNMHGYKVLGVHVRGTDHWAEMEDQTLPTMEKWIQDAEALFGTMEEPKKIFLASDNDEIVGRFVEHFGENKVIYTAAIRANKYHSNHPINGVFTNDTDPIEIGSQVLIDILLLAKCGHFLHAESSVATLVSFFNPEMKLSFLGNLDTRVDDGNLKQKRFPDSNEDIEAKLEKEWGEQVQSPASCFQAEGPSSACPNKDREQKDGDFKQKPFPDSSEESEIEWEEGWGDQIQSLAWCFQANGPYSACPNMAKGQLIDSKEVRTFLAK